MGEFETELDRNFLTNKRTLLELQMARRIFILFAFFMFASDSSAQTVTNVAVDKLAIELGIPQILQASKQSTARNVKEQLDIVFSQFEKNGMPEEFTLEMRKPAEAMMLRIRDSWDTTEAARIYTAEISAILTPEEIQEASNYYASPEGKITFDAINSGQSKMNAYISSKVTESMNKEFGLLMAQMRGVASEYLKKRKKP